MKKSKVNKLLGIIGECLLSAAFGFIVFGTLLVIALVTYK